MAGKRQGRVNSSVRDELSEIIREVKDPRISGALITISAADVSADLKYAKIYWSSITDEEGKKEISRGLRSASGFIRRRLAERLNMRITPELTFICDDTIEHGTKIACILREIDAERQNKNESEDKTEA
ncbi:MAG: 30S ribosome-binding factor RbfA [Firmicutes bacterium]|nr:30S ribosome-binding factor RbfA [Bacillota bacterium]